MVGVTARRGTARPLAEQLTEQGPRFLRLAGSARLTDGRRLLWSLAEGHRGRRWWATIEHRGLRSALLLELSTDGEPARLELATAAGMLTLHPEQDRRSIHGNAVGEAGVRPIALPWSPEYWLHVAGHPITAAALAYRFAETLRVGEGTDVPVVVIGPDLRATPSACRVRRGATGWDVVVGGDVSNVSLSLGGIPRFADEAEEWPLEE